MAARAHRSLRLLDRLPMPRGELRADAPLAKGTWFRVGGSAEVLFRPRDIDDLTEFLRAKPAGVSITILGAGTNVLVRDGGVDGVVVRLGKSFAGIRVEDNRIVAGGAAMDVNVARAAAAANLAGLEFLSGIPGTIGGAVRMNAGAYGHELRDVLISAEAVDPRGGHHVLKGPELGLSYRACAVPEEWIFVSATLRGRRGGSEDIRAGMLSVQAARAETQPIRAKTGGSTFANPAGPEAAGAKAWELIERAGCRGLRRGGAVVSGMHCNFLVNDGAATAADLEALAEEVRRRVAETSGVVLRWEIQRIGKHGRAVSARAPVEGSGTS